MISYMSIYYYICKQILIYETMINPNYITNREIMEVLADRLKQYRLAMRMSQRELAEKSGVGYTTISRFEQGKNANLTLGNFISLLRVAGLEERLMEVIPELPVAPLALREINKLIPKRVRRKDNAKKP